MDKDKPTRAISLWQPWATLITIKAKQYETRSWSTPYRGPVIIHAAKRFQLEERQLTLTHPFRECLQNAGFRSSYDLPLGVYLAVIDLVEVVPTDKIRDSLSQQERAFGDYSPGRFAWKLENVRVFPEPIQARGRQGFWNPLEGITPPMARLIGELYR